MKITDGFVWLLHVAYLLIMAIPTVLFLNWLGTRIEWVDYYTGWETRETYEYYVAMPLFRLVSWPLPNLTSEGSES